MRNRGLSARIAWRYLRAPKSHSAVSAISAISVTGVAVATAAIVCVLSVFNGFQSLLTEKFDILTPDLVVSPARGKVFADSDSIARIISGVGGVEMAMPSVVDNALAIVGGREMPVTLRGVDTALYPLMTSVDSIMFGGRSLASVSPGEVVASVGVASQLGIHTPGVRMLLFAPRREGRVNLSNPVASFLTDSVDVADVFQAMQSDYDENNVICHIDVARSLFQYDREASVVEVRLAEGAGLGRVAEDVRNALGPEAVVKDRFQQQEISFRMVTIEKWVTFLLLSFILVIAFFNIISTLCMLIIEKEESMSVLSALGMSRRGIGALFGWESLMVSLLGGIAGVALGVALCLLQQKFGLIGLGGDPESMMIDAYPVVVELSDVLLSLVPVVIIGGLTSLISSFFARSRIG